MQCGISPKYVLDEMQMYEINALMDNKHLAVKDSWEQSRMIAYIIAQVNSKKKLNPDDIIKFSWDEDTTSGDTNISDEDIKRLRQKADNYLKMINNG